MLCLWPRCCIPNWKEKSPNIKPLLEPLNSLEKHKANETFLSKASSSYKMRETSLRQEVSSPSSPSFVSLTSSLLFVQKEEIGTNTFQDQLSISRKEIKEADKIRKNIFNRQNALEKVESLRRKLTKFQIWANNIFHGICSLFSAVFIIGLLIPPAAIAMVSLIGVNSISFGGFAAALAGAALISTAVFVLFFVPLGLVALCFYGAVRYKESKLRDGTTELAQTVLRLCKKPLPDKNALFDSFLDVFFMHKRVAFLKELETKVIPELYKTYLPRERNEKIGAALHKQRLLFYRRIAEELSTLLKEESLEFIGGLFLKASFYKRDVLEIPQILVSARQHKERDFEMIPSSREILFLEFGALHLIRELLYLWCSRGDSVEILRARALFNHLDTAMKLGILAGEEEEMEDVPHKRKLLKEILLKDNGEEINEMCRMIACFTNAKEEVKEIPLNTNKDSTI